MKEKKNEKKYLLGYILSGAASVLTHWVFGAFIIGMPVLEILLESREKLVEELKKPLLMFLFVLPFYGAFFATSSIKSYITTSFGDIFSSAAPLLLLAGLITVRKKYASIGVFTAGSLGGMLVFYGLNLPIPFRDMIQFALPVLAGFYVAATRDELWDEGFEKFFTLLMLVVVVAGFAAQFSIGSDSSRSITGENFDKLVDARENLPDKIIVPGEGVGSWVTLASEDRPVASPFSNYNSSELDSEKFYYLDLED